MRRRSNHPHRADRPPLTETTDTCGRSRLGLTWAVALLLGATALFAEGPRAHSGSFSTEIGLEIPEYRGLEPDLKLVYSSTGRNTWIGPGWSLGGVSAIERGTPRGGAPTYDDAVDTFYLDGAEMMECDSQGGTHCTRIQNYARIEQDLGADRWLVYGTNGHLATFDPVVITERGTFRWMLSRLEDAFGNTVDYEYWCDEDRDCYLDRILYNGTTITFRSQPRTDKISYARGVDLGETRYRLAAISVEVDDETARAYALQYGESPATGASVLETIQRYGRDARVDSDGEVTGTALPAMRMTWRRPDSDVSNAPFAFEQSLPGASAPTQSFLNSDRAIEVGDWNGDGRADMLHLHPHSDPRYSWVALSNGDGTFDFDTSLPGASEASSSFLTSATAHDIRVGDWNGDGLSDLLYLYPHSSPSKSWVALSKGDGTFDFRNDLPGASVSTNSYLSPGHRDIYVGDWNGDGRSDLLHLHPTSDPRYSWVALSNGDGTFDFQQRLPGASTATNSYLDASWRIHVGDWNGDGRTDLAYLHPSGNPQYSWTALSNGDGTFDFQQRLPGASASTNSYLGGGGDTFEIKVGDWNADGKQDLLYLHPNDNPRYSWVALSNGDGSFDFRRSLPGASTATSSFLNSNRTIQVGDWNGDGRTDLLHLHPYSNPIYSWIGISRGDGTFEFHQALPGASPGTNSHLGDNRYILPADFDGDGTTDLAYLHNTSHVDRSWVALSRHRMGDLVERIDNGLGGSTQLDFVPSSQWDNTNMPFGLILPTLEAITVEDGRGSASTTAFHYQGGLWSPEERRFLGFRRAVQVIDAQGTTSETYFVQRVGSLSKPEKTYLHTADEKLYRYTEYGYTENDAPPYTSVLTEKWDYECNETTNCRKVLTQFAYDEFANVVATYEHGSVEHDGDERTTIRGYVPNRDRYITGLPAYEAIYEGIGTSGKVAKQTLYHYDGASRHDAAPRVGKLTETLEWNNATDGYVRHRFDYDSAGNLTRTWNAEGAVTVTVWDDAYGVFPVNTCNALGHCVAKTWDPVLGVPRFETDPNGAVTEHRYDALGRRISTTNPDGGTTTTEYLDWGDPNAQRVRTTQPDGTSDGLWSEVFQDGLGRSYRLEREGGIVQQTTFVDASERVHTQTLPFRDGDTPAEIIYSYDGAGRIQTVSNPDGTYAETAYGTTLDGQIVTTTYDEMGRERVVWSDGLGRMTQVRESEFNGLERHHTTHVYDALDRLVRSIDALGHQVVNTWDSLGRKLATEDFDAGRRTYVYDDDGLLLTQTDARGRAVHYAYDAIGRPTRKTSADGTITWSYDEPGQGNSIGRLTSVRYPNGRESHVYDLNGREVATTRCVRSDCQTLQRQFDPIGRLSALTFPDGETVQYRYDSSGRLESVAGYLMATEWNAAGQPTRLSFGNGTEASYTYSPHRQWLEYASVSSYGQAIYESEYGYDDVGRVIHSNLRQAVLPPGEPPVPDPSVIFADGFESGDTGAWGAGARTGALPGLAGTMVESTRSYAYDDLGRLVSVQGDEEEVFAYDAIGNLVHNSGMDLVYDDPGLAHAPTRAGQRVLRYDAGGNVIDDGRRQLHWNAENRLAAVTAGSQATHFLYDADGNRIEKAGPEGTQVFFFNELERIDGELVKYIWAGPMLIARRDSDGPTWIHSDHLGSVRLLTDATGDVARSYEYDTRGEVTDSGGPPSSRGFAGHIGDPETDLVYMGARYYDPELGRFLSPDPLVPDPFDPQSFNRYSYALNNPVSFVDPTGHAPVAVAIASIFSITVAHTPWVVITAVVGAGMSVAGDMLDSPILSTIGSILLGFVDGYSQAGWIGGVAGALNGAAQSDLSPLSDEWKQKIDSAYDDVIEWLVANGHGPPAEVSSPELQQALARYDVGAEDASDLVMIARSNQAPLADVVSQRQRPDRLVTDRSASAAARYNQRLRASGVTPAGRPAAGEAGRQVHQGLGTGLPRGGERRFGEALLLDPTSGALRWMSRGGHDASRPGGAVAGASCASPCSPDHFGSVHARAFDTVRQSQLGYRGYAPIS